MAKIAIMDIKQRFKTDRKPLEYKLCLKMQFLSVFSNITKICLFLPISVGSYCLSNSSSSEYKDKSIRQPESAKQFLF